MSTPSIENAEADRDAEHADDSAMIAKGCAEHHAQALQPILRTLQESITMAHWADHKDITDACNYIALAATSLRTVSERKLP